AAVAVTRTRCLAREKSANRHVEAERIGHIEAEVPPLVCIVRETLRLECPHESLTVLPHPSGRGYGGCGGVGRVEGSSHVQGFPGLQPNQREIDREPEIVAAAAGDVAVSYEVRTADALGPLDHCFGRARRTVSIPEEQPQTVRFQRLVCPRKRLGSL